MAISDTNKYFKQCRTSICASHRSIAFPVCPHFSVTGGQPGEVCIVTLCVHVSAGVRSAHPVNRLDFHDLWKIWINRWQNQHMQPMSGVT